MWIERLRVRQPLTFKVERMRFFNNEAFAGIRLGPDYRMAEISVYLIRADDGIWRIFNFDDLDLSDRPDYATERTCTGGK